MIQLQGVPLTDILNTAICSLKDGTIITGNPERDKSRLIEESEKRAILGLDNLYECHICMEIGICLNGNFVFCIGDNLFKASNNDIIVLMPGVVHTEVRDNQINNLTIWMTIENDKLKVFLAGRISNENYYRKDIYLLDSFTEPGIIANKITKELVYNHSVNIEQVRNWLIEICSDALKLTNRKQEERLNSYAVKEIIVQKIEKHIEEHYSDPLKLNEIARGVSASVSYVNNVFKAFKGKTVMQYIDDLRIQKAKQLLKDTNQSISSISAQLGFCNQYYFSISFKKKTGYSPVQFRKLN